MYLDTRGLVEKREELKQAVLDSFLEEFKEYVDKVEVFEDIPFDAVNMDYWKLLWAEELTEITCIDEVEEEVEGYSGDNFEFGVTLISEDDFQEYCEDFVKDCGFVPQDLPNLIENNIDWNGVADDMRYDYTEVEFQGKTYLFR